MDNEQAESTMDALAEAWDAAEGNTGEGDGFDSTDQVVEEDSADSTDVVAEAEFGHTDEGSSEVGESTDPADSAETDGDGGAEGTRGQPDERPPVSLSAAAREAWKDTPPAMRAEIAKREADFARGIQKYAESAKRVQSMDRMLAPYSQYFAINGGAPKAIGEALQTAALLQQGSPVQKAQAAAQLIKQFGVDISTLDSLLVGEAPPEAAQVQSQVQQAVQQAVAPYQQQMASMQQAQQATMQRAQQEVYSEVDAFGADPAHEFYHDVKLDMADIMDLAAQRGLQLSLKDAYDRACTMNPEIQRIVQNRRSQQSLQSKRRAASSVGGAPAGDAAGAPPASLRGAIADAWENAGRT
jgi:cytochrome c556